MSLSAGRVGVRADQVDSHGRVISPSFLNEIMEDLPEWTDLPVRVNGTEQLIPSNPSVPVTSPILADIDYPDIRRNNQYFTYRESPTTVDGLAKIKSIKGNTLVWNQLIQIPVSDASTTINGVTITDNRDGSYTLNGTATANGSFVIATNVSTPVGHKFLVQGYAKVGSNTGFMGFAGLNVDSGSGGIWTNNLTYNQLNARIEIKSDDTFNNTKMTPQFFDLTAMGLDSLTVDKFKALFPLPYYSYDSGSLLSFNGTGIKVTGKNLISDVMQGYSIASNGGYIYSDPGTSNYAVSIARVESGKTYYLSDTGLNRRAFYYDKPVSGMQSYNGTIREIRRSFIAPITGYVAIVTSLTASSGLQLETGGSTEYEQYTEHTTSLPTETYFPTGMKSAGTAYDELTPTKAIIRINQITIDGTLRWYSDNDRTNRFGINNSLWTYPTPSANVLNRQSNYLQVSGWAIDSYQFAVRDTGAVYVCLDANGTQMTLDEFKAYMNAHPLTINYELATPVELPTLDFGE